MTRVLAIADEVDEVLYGRTLRTLRPELVLSCGDLPFDYLEYIVTMTNVPLLFVPGNHDPDLRPRPQPAWPAPILPPGTEEPPGPRGCLNVDLRVADAAGLRVAGFGGTPRYHPGPNRYSERELRARARRLRRRAARRRLRDRRPVDVLIAHAPPLGYGDGDDPAHRGSAALVDLVRRLGPRFLLHGHVHPYGRRMPDRRLASTTVVNVVPFRLLEVPA
ncbi:MAG TPA: metallophosphoesterase [Actinomycetota bacterium]|nr:metallophosphoesterase [Actinomycetota bacterium]